MFLKPIWALLGDMCEWTFKENYQKEIYTHTLLKLYTISIIDYLVEYLN